MAEESLPENYEWYEDQIAGHHPSVIKNGKREIGILKKPGSSKILKLKQDARRGESEVGLYKLLATVHSEVNGNCLDSYNLWNARTDDVRAMASLTPKFYGTKTLTVDGENHEFITLEDVCFHYQRPAILDIKMGRQTFDPLASPKKKLRESTKYPPQQILGYRLLGYRIHLAEKVRSQDKKWGMDLDEKTVVHGLREFLEGGRGQDRNLVKNVLSELAPIHEWFKYQRSFKFFGSSLLVIYETEPHLQANPRVYMIDFSHVFDAEGELDDNYLHGLNVLVDHLKEL